MKESTQEQYIHKALCYAEKYGIIEYKVKTSKMIYYVSYPHEGTYKVTIDLNTMQDTRTHLKKYMKIGEYNRG